MTNEATKEEIKPITAMHRSGDGTVMMVCDMDDLHLLRTLKRTFHTIYRLGYLTEAQRRGLVGAWPTNVEIMQAIKQAQAATPKTYPCCCSGSCWHHPKGECPKRVFEDNALCTECEGI